MFDPVKFGLGQDFQLTKFSTLRGWGCKIPQDTLLRYLQGTGILQCNEKDGKIYGDNDYIGE